MEIIVNLLLLDVLLGQLMELLLHVIHVKMDSIKMGIIVQGVQIIALLVLLLLLVVLVYHVLIKMDLVHAHHVLKDVMNVTVILFAHHA